MNLLCVSSSGCLWGSLWAKAALVRWFWPKPLGSTKINPHASRRWPWRCSKVRTLNKMSHRHFSLSAFSCSVQNNLKTHIALVWSCKFVVAQRMPQRRIYLTWSLKWKWWRWSVNTRTSSTCWEPALRTVRVCVTGNVHQQDCASHICERSHPRLSCVLTRPPVCGGGVRLEGKPEGVPPRSPTSRVGVLEQLQSSFSGQFGDHGAGFCCVPGSQRNGLPGLKEG